jgi:predicted transcriptional regulator
MAIRFGDGLLDKLLRERARHFGPILRGVLKEFGLSQYKLAWLANVGPVDLNRIVKGHRPPTEVQALRIACAVIMNKDQRSLASSILEEAGFDPLGLEDEAAEEYLDEGRRVSLGG